jgi:hypothetical protein
VTPGALWIGEPLQPQILKKLRKAYPEHSAHELIAYYARQKPLPGQLEALRDVLTDALPESAFRRVWVMVGKTLEMHFPEYFEQSTKAGDHHD